MVTQICKDVDFDGDGKKIDFKDFLMATLDLSPKAI